jgi:hypothetical protein
VNDTNLESWLVPKPVPVKVIKLPIWAAGGAILVIAGLMTSKATVEGLVLEPTVTTTGPVPAGAALGTVAMICVLLQLDIDVAVIPLNVRVLVP